MADQNRLTEFLQAVACIDDDAIFSSFNGGAFRNHNVDTVINGSTFTLAEARENATTNRPTHL
ncbi:hypothetical protein D3C72_2562670 [compost metagenome]